MYLLANTHKFSTITMSPGKTLIRIRSSQHSHSFLSVRADIYEPSGELFTSHSEKNVSITHIPCQATLLMFTFYAEAWATQALLA